jgi:hypothetical protein
MCASVPNRRRAYHDPLHPLRRAFARQAELLLQGRGSVMNAATFKIKVLPKRMAKKTEAA